MTSTSFLKASAALLLAACAGTGHASCGASACSLMTDRYAQGADVHPGWSADLRLEALMQRRLRSGTRSIDAADLAGVSVIRVQGQQNAREARR